MLPRQKYFPPSGINPAAFYAVKPPLSSAFSQYRCRFIG